nr:segregation/condensation protein A [uncultured Mogibacterium sp.]
MRTSINDPILKKWPDDYKAAYWIHCYTLFPLFMLLLFRPLPPMGLVLGVGIGWILAEYVKTKKIAEMLQERLEANQCIHEKPAEDMSEYLDSPDELLKADIEQFINAFNAFLQKKKRVADVKKRYQRIKRERASIEDRISYMTAIIKDRVSVGEYIDFTELVPEAADRYDITLSFMSLLEMIKMQEVDAKQEKNYGNISVIKKEVQTDVQ